MNQTNQNFTEESTGKLSSCVSLNDLIVYIQERGIFIPENLFLGEDKLSQNKVDQNMEEVKKYFYSILEYIHDTKSNKEFLIWDYNKCKVFKN